MPLHPKYLRIFLYNQSTTIKLRKLNFDSTLPTYSSYPNFVNYPNNDFIKMNGNFIVSLDFYYLHTCLESFPQLCAPIFYCF